MAHTNDVMMAVVVRGLGTVATADQVQSFLVEQGYNDPARFAVDEGEGIFVAGVATTGSERRIASEVPRWNPESGDLRWALVEVIGHDDWQACVVLGREDPAEGGDEGEPQAHQAPPDEHTGQYL